MAKMASLDNLENTVEKIQKSIAKHEAIVTKHKATLADIQEKIARFSSPEFLAEQERLAEQKEQELKRLQDSIAKRKLASSKVDKPKKTKE